MLRPTDAANCMDFELDTRYRVSQPVASRKLTAGRLNCCCSRRTTTQYVTSAVRTLVGSMRRKGERKAEWDGERAAR